MTSSRSRPVSAFSLVELLVVIGIIALLSALLFPVFLTVRGKARQAVCASNLRQIGAGITMYTQDYDGLYPHAIDPIDRVVPNLFVKYPDFAAAIPHLPLLQDALYLYSGSHQIFCCPSDSGFEVDDFYNLKMDAFPSSFEKYGTSYLYRTEIVAAKAGDSSFPLPAQISVLLDLVGQWHGTLIPLELRYNVLFADGHVKNLTRSQTDEAWTSSLFSDQTQTP